LTSGEIEGSSDRTPVLRLVVLDNASMHRPKASGER